MFQRRSNFFKAVLLFKFLLFSGCHLRKFAFAGSNKKLFHLSGRLKCHKESAVPIVCFCKSMWDSPGPEYGVAGLCLVKLLAYLNRLSDHLFVAARHVASLEGGDVLWKPGGERSVQG